ncbi:MAG: hypothetical protein NXI27_26635 [Alphaproteobacteria bacterium]|nr:hypothetical protein [Alphaproteobacteria bacterium]
MENAFQLKTRRATGVLGMLIRQWAVDLDTRPPFRLEGDCRWIIAVEDFRDLLKSHGLEEARSETDSGDYLIRDDIEEIELITRKPNRFSVLLPEADIIRSLADSKGASQMQMATLYADVDPARPELDMGDLRDPLDDDRPATYKVTMDGDGKFEKFLDPYMAAYVCSQCL